MAEEQEEQVQEDEKKPVDFESKLAVKKSILAFRYKADFHLGRYFLYTHDHHRFCVFMM